MPDIELHQERIKERSRIRYELLEVAEGWEKSTETALLRYPGFIFSVLLSEALDRICPEEE